MSKGLDFIWDDKPIDVTAEVNMIRSIANKLRYAAARSVLDAIVRNVYNTLKKTNC